MKNLTDYLEESMAEMPEETFEEGNEDTVYAVVDTDLDGAIMSTWDLKEDAETEKADRLKENADLHLDIKPIKRSEVEKK